MKLLQIDRRHGAYPHRLTLRIDIDREDDGRWIVDAVDLPGVMCYGTTKKQAVDLTARLALHVIDERIEHGEDLPDLDATPPDPSDAVHTYHA